jgi:hypothetical protein
VAALALHADAPRRAPSPSAQASSLVFSAQPLPYAFQPPRPNGQPLFVEDPGLGLTPAWPFLAHAPPPPPAAGPHGSPHAGMGMGTYVQSPPSMVSRVGWWALRLSAGNLSAAPLLLQVLQVKLTAHWAGWT